MGVAYLAAAVAALAAGLTPRGLLTAGDLTEMGQPHEWARFEAIFGLTGKEGWIRYPVFEGAGNHDVGYGTFVQEQIQGALPCFGDLSPARARRVPVGSVKHSSHGFAVVHVIDTRWTVASYNYDRRELWWWHDKPIFGAPGREARWLSETGRLVGQVRRAAEK